MDNNILAELQSLLPEVNAKRGYWFVRTLGGRFYDDFLTGGYIAIGYDEVPASTMKDVDKDEESFEKFVDRLRQIYKEPNTRHRFIAKQLVKFVHEISTNDVVMIPSAGSHEVRVGLIQNRRVYNRSELKSKEEECDWEKRKKVKWLRTFRRSDLNPELFRFLYSQQAIVDARAYADDFDRMLGSLFVKAGEAHIIFEVTQKDNIPAKALFGIGNDALELFDEFCEENGLSYRSTDLNVKIKVESPGWIEITTMVVASGLLFVLMLSKLSGGSGTTTFKALGIEFTHQFKTNSLLDKLGSFLVTKAKVRFVDKYIQQIGLENPKEVAQILQALDEGKKQLPPAEPPNEEAEGGGSTEQ